MLIVIPRRLKGTYISQSKTKKRIEWRVIVNYLTIKKIGLRILKTWKSRGVDKKKITLSFEMRNLKNYAFEFRRTNVK